MSRSYKTNSKVASYNEDVHAGNRRRGLTALIVIVCIIFVLGLFVAAVALANTLIDEDWAISSDNVVEGALLKAARSMAPVVYDEERIVPVYNSDGVIINNTTGRDFKLIQLTDVHIGGGSFSHQKDLWAINAVAKMLQEEKPDFVIVTGDIAYPVPFQAGTFNNLRATKIFATLMETLGVYWTFAYGNHDTEAYSMYERGEINDWYTGQIAEGKLKYCMYTEGFSDAYQKEHVNAAKKARENASDMRAMAEEDDINRAAYLQKALNFEAEADRELALSHMAASNTATPDAGYGNQVIQLQKNGKPINDLVIFDSHSYTDNDYFGMMWKYDNIHQSQIDWYAEKMEEDGNIKNIAFFHIPLKEYREAYKQVKEGTLTANYGIMGEEERERNGVKTYGVFCGENDDLLFETGLERNMQGIFCGHDHYNNFSIDYTAPNSSRSIRLTYGMSVDYLAYVGIYKKHAQRGCTVITITDDGSFTNVAKNYYTDYGVSVEKGSNSDLTK